MKKIVVSGVFTPFGEYIREKCRDSKTGLSITDIDHTFYCAEDFRNRTKRKYMFIDEKGFNAKLEIGQAITYQVMDICFRIGSKFMDYDYWGFYVLQFVGQKSIKGSSPNSGLDDWCTTAYLNGKQITANELIKHINFEKKFTRGLNGFNPDSWSPFLKYGRLMKLKPAKFFFSNTDLLDILN